MLLIALVILLVGCTICPPCPECPICPPCETATPAPTATATATPVPDKPACWDAKLDELGVTVERRNGSLELIAAWTTQYGSWEVVPACAKQYQNDTLGGDHHAYGMALDRNGQPIFEREEPFAFALVWPDGGDTRQPEPTGWANLILAGQNWNPADGPGPYTLFVYGGDKLVGIGMPHNHHWSFFGVWAERPSMAAQDAAEMDVRR